MTDPNRADDGPGGIGDALVAERQRPSVVWIIPLIAVLVGAFVAWRVLSERGPEVSIHFASAEGLEAGKTRVKYKDVEVGLVEAVTLEKDLSGVAVKARMVAGAESYLRENTRFWIVRPRITGGQVTGLATLMSGAYIGIDPVLDGKRARDFKGLDVAPVVALQEAGRYFVLHSNRAGAFDVGTPVFFRRISVGQVVSSQLEPDSDQITTRIFVRAPYDARVLTDTRFWDASGIQATIGADGVKIDTESMVSILVGGIAFDTSGTSSGAPADAEATFTLFESHEAAERPVYARTATYLLHFDQSVRGLKVGAPVEFRGIEIGEVTDIQLQFDPKTARFDIPVTIEIESERVTNLKVSAENRENVDRLVAAGLRAQLKSGNLLTGQLIVALDMHPNAPPAQVTWHANVGELPTIPTPIEEITASLTQLVDKLGKLPVEEIGTDLQRSLAALRETLEKAEGVGPALADTLQQATRTLSSTDSLIGPDSTANAELRRTLLELSEAARALALAAEQIQTQPNSLLFGRQGSE